MTTEALSAYTHEFDQRAYARLWDTPLEVHQTERERLDLYTEKQLQTLLAERFNVLSSTFNYEMRDGQLWGENMNEPAIESFRRGRDYRKREGNPIDWKREEAEVVGFEKIEQMLREEKDVLSISPRGVEGSTYQHNFYDVFRWRNEKVEAKRYSSALDLKEYQRILGLDHEPTAEELLANPIDISNMFDSPEEVHKHLHRGHEYTSDRVFGHILSGTRMSRHELLQAYYDGDEQRQEFWFNTTLNAADEIKVWAEELGEGDVYAASLEFSAADYARFGNQEVRETTAGCGGSGGFKKRKTNALDSIINPFSVKEFGEDEEGECEECKQSSADKHYHCPGCSRRYSDETSKSAEDRTKECGCGFKFGC